MTWRVLLTGSRTWEETVLLRRVLAYVWHPEAVLVHGACKHGADALADACWRAWGGTVERHPANWDRYGRRAGFVRNEHMVKLGADVCVAFIRDASRGASHAAAASRAAGIVTWTFPYPRQPDGDDLAARLHEPGMMQVSGSAAGTVMRAGVRAVDAGRPRIGGGGAEPADELQLGLLFS